MHAEPTPAAVVRGATGAWCRQRRQLQFKCKIEHGVSPSQGTWGQGSPRQAILDTRWGQWRGPSRGGGGGGGVVGGHAGGGGVCPAGAALTVALVRAEDYATVESHIYAIVPCSCIVCRHRLAPHFIPGRRLLRWHAIPQVCIDRRFSKKTYRSR